MEIKGVKIGDKFIMNGKAKREAIVVDFHTVINLSGEIMNEICIAENELLGQKIRFETPFSTVVKNKIK